MSDIRFNQWLHNSGTGGISQDSAGHVGIGTTVPTHINALTNNNSILHVGIVSCNTLNAASKIEGSIDDWIIHQDDTNTKFGFPAADQFQVYVAGAPKITATSTEITAAVQVNIESAGSYIKSNQLKFNPNGDAFIDHGVTSKDITFRLSNSSALDFNAIKIDSSAQQTKFGKQIVVGLQGGNDVTTIGGGSGIGAYIQLEHASSGINTKLMGNNDSYLNQFHGNLAIGEDNPDGNKLLIRAASTVGTNRGHIMLTGDSATNGQGPQIVFSESGSGSQYAGAYVGHIREGSNSTGSLVFGTRGTGGDGSTVPDERIRIYSTGQILYSAASGDNQITSKRTNSAGSNGNYFFHLKAQASGGTDVGALGFHRDTNTDDSRLVFFTKKTGGSESLTERMRITSDGKIGVNVTDPKSQLHLYAPSDLRMGSVYGGVALIALQVEYASGYTGTHFMVEITDQASYSFEGSHIVHGSGGSSYGTEVTVVRMQASREAGATDSGDTWRNGTVKYNNNFTAHDQVGLNPGAGTFSFTYDDTATTTTSIQKISFSASGQGVGVWSKLNGVFTWASASVNGRVKIKDKDGNVLWDSNP